MRLRGGGPRKYRPHMMTPRSRDGSGYATRSRFLAALAGAVAALSIVTAFGPVGAQAAPVGGDLAPLPFNHFIDYEEMTRLLHAWAAAKPGLMKLESLGKTPEGRELWFLTLTNKSTGPDSGKPAIIVDGGMHALEWIGSVAALNFAWTLLRDYGHDPNVTKLLDTRAVYVLPRLSPDGMEETLHGGRVIRSAIRPAPGEPTHNGLRMRDLDGDGQIVFMRYRDPDGPWKQDPSHPRLLVPRGPEDNGGEHWRVAPEGLIDGPYNGETYDVLPALEGVDFGVFFPDPRDPVPAGAVKEPDASRVPEVADYTKAIRDRPNIFAHVTCHSFGGELLTPPVNTDDEMPSQDHDFYDVMGRRITSLMGYEAQSYLELRAGRDLKTYIPTEIGWLYNKLGIYSFITEFWNPLKAAGVTPEGQMSTWLGGLHPIGDDIKLLEWSDTTLGGKGFVAWHDFNHPQLGPVQIGGWDKIHYWYNPPLDRLQREVAPHAEWLIQLGLSSPRIVVHSFTATPDGPDRWHLRLVIGNVGWLPTSGSRKAAERKVVGGIVAAIDLPAGTRLVEGSRMQDVGQLEGRSEQHSIATWWGYEPGTPDRAVADWTVTAPAGTTITATAGNARAGRAAAQVVLGQDYQPSAGTRPGP